MCECVCESVGECVCVPLGFVLVSMYLYECRGYVHK